MPTITQLRASYQSGDLTPTDAIRSLADSIESCCPVDTTTGTRKGAVEA